MTEENNKYWEQTCQRIQSYIAGRIFSEAWRTLRNLRNVGHNKINIQGISLNEGKLYFSKLLKKDRTAF